jgi:quinol monooxygenase YgiN
VILVHADIYAQIPERAAVREAMLAAQTAAREQDGCISFVYAETLEEPGHFLAVERWRDAATFEAHFRSEAYAAYVAAVTPLLVRDSEVRIYEGLQALLSDSSTLDLRQDD